MKNYIHKSQNAVRLSHVSAVLKLEEGYLLVLKSGTSCHISEDYGKEILAHLN